MSEIVQKLAKLELMKLTVLAIFHYIKCFIDKTGIITEIKPVRAQVKYCFKWLQKLTPVWTICALYRYFLEKCICADFGKTGVSFFRKITTKVLAVAKSLTKVI